MSYFKSYFFVHYTSPIDAVYFLKINKASEGEYIKQYLSFHCPPLTNKCRLHLPAKKYTQNPFFPTSNNI